MKSIHLQSSVCILIVLGFTGCCGLPIPPAAAPTPTPLQPALFDFGDAPDPTFPTLFASNGARTLDPSQFWLGSLGAPGATLEQEAQIIDNDQQDDGLIEVLVENKVNLVFQAAKSPQAQAGVVYFNLLADENGDGRWQDFSLPLPEGSFPTSSPLDSSVDQNRMTPVRNFTEWVVVNQPVTLAPGETTTIKAEVLEAGGNLQVWLRAALTDSPIDVSPRWDGTGQFQQGEIEDHRIGPEYTYDVSCDPNPLNLLHGVEGQLNLIDSPPTATDMKVTHKAGEMGPCGDPPAQFLAVDPAPGELAAGKLWLNFDDVNNNPRGIKVEGTNHPFTTPCGNTLTYWIDFMVKGPLGVATGQCKVIVSHPAVAAPPPTTYPAPIPPTITYAPPTVI